MKKLIIINSLNFDPKIHLKPAVISEASKTIPDQSMTVGQIMQRYASGSVPALYKQPVFENPETPSQGIDFKKLDLIDLEKMTKEAMELKSKATKEIEIRKKHASEAAKTREFAKMKETIEADLKARYNKNNEE